MVVGNNNQFALDYNKKSDILNIRKQGAKTAGSFELDKVTVDFDTHATIVGIEVEHASDVLSNFGMTENQLEELTLAEFQVEPSAKHKRIQIRLVLQDGERIIPISAHMTAISA